MVNLLVSDLTQLNPFLFQISKGTLEGAKFPFTRRGPRSEIVQLGSCTDRQTGSGSLCTLAKSLERHNKPKQFILDLCVD